MSGPVQRALALKRARAAWAGGRLAGLAIAGGLAAWVATDVVDHAAGRALAAPLLIRAAFILVLLSGVGAYDRVIRGESRGVLTLLPVDPWDVVRAEMREVMVAACWAVGCAGVALAPLWVAWPGLLGPGLLTLLSVAVLGAITAALASLMAVRVADDPRWAGLLDLIRGANPRAQAALIYALLPSTLVTGLVAVVSVDQAIAVADGAGLPFAVGIGWAVSVGGWYLLPGVARASWFQASVVLSEIRARYEALAQPRAALEVGMDFTLQWLPAPVARHAAIELRHGWREQRGWLMSGWLVAVLVLSMMWRDPQGAALPGGVALGGVAWLGVVVLRARVRATHPWLAALLDQPGPRGLGRSWAVLAWAAGPLLTTAMIVAVVHGLGTGLIVLIASVAHAGVAAALAAVALDERSLRGGHA